MKKFKIELDVEDVMTIPSSIHNCTKNKASIEDGIPRPTVGFDCSNLEYRLFEKFLKEIGVNQAETYEIVWDSGSITSYIVLELPGVSYRYLEEELKRKAK